MNLIKIIKGMFNWHETVNDNFDEVKLQLENTANKIANIERMITYAYSDPINGDDVTGAANNANKPFKTIEGFLSRFPTGNVGVLIVGDITCKNTLNIANRNLIIRGGKVISEAAPLFRLNSGSLMAERAYFELSDSSLIECKGACFISMGALQDASVKQLGTGTANIVYVSNESYWMDANGVSFVTLNLQNVSLHGESGVLNVIGNQRGVGNNLDRCPVYVRLSAVTKDLNTFWCNGSDTLLSRINDTFSYVANW